jgi:hypothetical protein
MFIACTMDIERCGFGVEKECYLGYKHFAPLEPRIVSDIKRR